MRRKRNYLAIMEEMRRQKAIHGLSQPHDPYHWACPDCGQVCRCQGELQQMRHVPCGRYEL